MWSFMLETVLEKLILKAGVCGPVEMCLSDRCSLYILYTPFILVVDKSQY